MNINRLLHKIDIINNGKHKIVGSVSHSELSQG